jgi:hypothetical protein
MVDWRTTSPPDWSGEEKAAANAASETAARSASITAASGKNRRLFLPEFHKYPENVLSEPPCSRSDFNTSRHYLVGLPQMHLSAFGRRDACGPSRHGRSITRRTSRTAGVAAGLGTMNDQPNIIIGERHGWGEPQRFGISHGDQRQHIYIIGKTGSGKTTLLRNMIVQHLAAGHGVGLIDPHGDLAEELLNHIPPWRADHLCYFNPDDLEYPVGLNLLANVPSDERHLVASGIVGAFKSIWRDSWGPRLEYIFYNAIAALLDCENTTLLGVNRLLTDDTYRAWVVRQIKDPFIREFWADEFASLSHGESPLAVESVVFYSPAWSRWKMCSARIVASPSSWAWKRVCRGRAS